MNEAMKTPILDTLRNVPEDARQVYEHDSMHSQNIPFGRMAREAADEIEAQAERIRVLQAELAKHQESQFHPDWSMLAATRDALAEHQQMVRVLENHLQFVERWANHHASKPHVTPQEALSVIQHYPPIKAITKAYADGKVPDTSDPYEHVRVLREACEAVDELIAYQYTGSREAMTMLQLVSDQCRAALKIAGDKPTPTPQQESALQKIADFGQEQERGPVRETVSRVVKGIIRNDKP